MAAVAEAPLSDAAAWAQKRAAAIEKAALRRAQLAQNTLGGSSSGSFLDRLGAAERRDEERRLQPPIPSSKAATPKRPATKSVVHRPREVSKTPDGPPPPRPPGSLQSKTIARQEKLAAKAAAVAQKRRAAAAAAAEAKEAQRQQFKAKVAASSLRMAPAIDPARALPQLGYEVVAPIAAGAFSTVLRCTQLATGMTVAVKSFDASKCCRDAAVGEARDNELSVLRRLRQRSAVDGATRGGGTVTVTGTGAGTSGGAADGDEDAWAEGHPHIANMLEELGDSSSAHQHAVLQFGAGGSLARFLSTLRSDLEAPAVASACAQLASALEHLHCLEIAHRDVKPSNCLLLHPPSAERALHLKLCDFGFATICGDRLLTNACGTPAYLAPEIVTSVNLTHERMRHVGVPRARARDAGPHMYTHSYKHAHAQTTELPDAASSPSVASSLAR